MVIKKLGDFFELIKIIFNVYVEDVIYWGFYFLGIGIFLVM